MTRRPAISSPCIPISSPCIDVCVMDAKSGLCTGCARTLDEIGGWGAMSEPRRREIMGLLPARLDRLGAAAAAPAEAKARIAAALEG